MSEYTNSPVDDIVVVKAGTSVLSYQTVLEKELLYRPAFRNIGQEVTRLAQEDRHPIVVSSASISAGFAFTGQGSENDRSKMPVRELQRLSSLGHWHLMRTWNEAIKDQAVGSLLITEHELSVKEEREELLEVLNTMLQHKDIPIVNENDSITHEEITFGDNDILAAKLVGRMALSPLFGNNINLVLLTDRVGLCEYPDDESSRIPVVHDIKSVEEIAGNGGPSSRGGMKSKLKAAEIANEAGVDMYIAHGKMTDVLKRTFRGETGTYFPAKTTS